MGRRRARAAKVAKGERKPVVSRYRTKKLVEGAPRVDHHQVRSLRQEEAAPDAEAKVVLSVRRALRFLNAGGVFLFGACHTVQGVQLMHALFSEQRATNYLRRLSERGVAVDMPTPGE